MTYSPAMKFHGFISKLIFNPICLILILSSCASLNTSLQTYNLEGKLSYVSDEISAIFLIKIFGDEKNLQISLFEPLNGGLIENLQGSGKYWGRINQKNSDFWKSSGSSTLTVCSITLLPAKPTKAFGSAMLISPNIAKLADTPPNIGSTITEI